MFIAKKEKDALVAKIERLERLAEMAEKELKLAAGEILRLEAEIKGLRAERESAKTAAELAAEEMAAALRVQYSNLFGYMGSGQGQNPIPDRGKAK